MDMESLLPEAITGDVSPVFNVGFAGYRCTDVINEVDTMFNTFTPDRIVLVCGENDLAYGASPEEAFAGYETAVNMFISLGVTVYSIGTKPEPAMTALHSDYRKLDDMIFELAAKLNGGLVFVDSYAGFVAAGNTNDLYAQDKLHLSSKGYGLWFDWLVVALEDEGGGCQVYKNGECVQDQDQDGCVSCSNKETPWMAKKGKTCVGKKSIFFSKRCTQDNWIKNEWCQLRCFQEGMAHNGETCCVAW